MSDRNAERDRIADGRDFDDPTTVEAYLDDRLHGPRLADFERAIASSPSLQATIRLGRSIDVALRRAFQPGERADTASEAFGRRGRADDVTRSHAAGLDAARGGPGAGPVPGRETRLRGGVDDADGALPADVQGALAISPKVGSSRDESPGESLPQNLRLRPRVLRGAAAAAIAAALTLAAVALWQGSKSNVVPRAPITEPAALHAALVADGFQPAWVCTSDREFIEYTRDTVGESFLIRDDGPLEVLGWAYAGPFLGDRTSMLLARHDGAPVVLLLDRLERDRVLTIAPETGLHLFRSVFGDAVAYEISPRAQPVLLPAMEFPAVVPP